MRQRRAGGGLTTLLALFKVWGLMLSLPALFGFLILNVAHAAVAGDERSLVTNSHGFAWPVIGSISSGFGFRAAPDRAGNEFHTGIDIAAPAGSPVQAVAPGVITFAGWAGTYGNLVKVRHETDDGYFETWYGHLSVIIAGKGAVVDQETIIGLVGSTGRSTGPHLHFEYRRVGGRHPADPLMLYR